MADWTISCPHCGETNRVPADELTLECGVMSFTRPCQNCGEAFSSEQAYWRWLGLEGPPSAEDESREAGSGPF